MSAASEALHKIQQATDARSCDKRGVRHEDLSFLESVAAEVSSVDLMEIAAPGGHQGKVDGNVIRGVKLLGFESQNPTLGYPTRYAREAVQKAIPLYEGAPIHVDHPPRDNPNLERRCEDRIGRVKNVRMEQDGLRGDAHLNPEHRLTKKILWEAANEPDLVGFSHNAKGAGSVVNGSYLVHELSRVNGLDLVTRPSTTRGLYESIQEAPMGAEAAKLMPGAQAPTTTTTTATPAPAPAAPAAKPAELSLMESRMLAAEEAAKKANDRLAAVEGELATANKKERIAGMIRDAKLRPEAVTPVFETALMEAKDDAAIKALIEDRAAVSKAGGTVQLVESRAPGAAPGPSASVSSVKVTDGRSFAQSLGVKVPAAK